MKTLSLAAALAAAVTLTACDTMDNMFNTGNSSTSSNTPTGPMGGTHRQMAVATPVSTMTTNYAQMAAMGDMFEIESSRIAIEKARNPRVKNFAQMMVTDHNQTSARLKAALPPGVNPPTQLDAQHQAKLATLRNTPAGAGFDRAYMREQVSAHEQALALHQNYSRNGDVAQLRELASSTAPVVEGHLREARTLAR